ncbi:MAG: penicillin-binding transpeptidase domain-containing protein [Lachnospiraceae bacterium]
MKEGLFQLVKSRLFVLIIVFVILFAVLIGRVFHLQIVNGQDALDKYKLKIRKTMEVQGTRGNIYDRNGKVLASNKLAYSVTIEDNGSYETLKEKNKILNKTINQIIDVVESHGDSVINDFGIVIDANDNYVFTAPEGPQRLRFIADIYGYKTIDELKEKERNSTADDIMKYLCQDERFGYGIDQKKIKKNHVLKLVNIRYAMGLNSFKKYIPTTVASNVSNETVATIMESLDQLQGVSIGEDSLRVYDKSTYFASIIGYTGKISQEELDTYKNDGKKYSPIDVIGKSGIEQTMDESLQGTKEEEIVYVDSVGKVLEKEKGKEAKAGNDLYLTIDKDLQEATYHLIEEKLAAILLSNMQNIMNYTPDPESETGKIIIPVDDVYNSFFSNEILNLERLSNPKAGPTEQGVAAQFNAKQENVLGSLLGNLQDSNSPAYKDMPKEIQAYMVYICNDVLENATGILLKDKIDTNDKTYLAWTKEESISLYTYLNYAISKNWVDTSKLKEYVANEGKYSSSNEVYQSILSYITEYLKTDNGFHKLIYKYMIKGGEISGTQICMMLYEQNVLAPDEGQYNGLASGEIDPYGFIRNKIQSLELTPGQLALEPCTGSAVVTDVKTGEVLACVSYPGYDNNRLANTMDAKYYNKLVNDKSRPFYNNATQEKTAPGSTYKMISSVAGLTEKVITDDTIISCSGVFDEIVPSPKCWIYPGAHGGLNVVGAIEHSCNDFFYDVGFMLGQTTGSVTEPDGTIKTVPTLSNDLGLEKLRKYATLFGLNEKSGLEIPEAEPQISDKDTVRSAIGQGTNNYTNSQLARYVTAVANKGTVFQLSLLDKVQSVDGKVVKDFKSKETRKITEIAPSTWNAVQTGMELMISSSTTFNGLGMSMAGKTGTAQQSTTHPDHGLFLGYAPAETPEISVSVRIANGYSSSYPAEIGRDIVKYKYGLATPEQLITGSASNLGEAAVGD